MNANRKKAPQKRGKRTGAYESGTVRRQRASKTKSSPAPQHRKTKKAAAVAQKPTCKAFIVETLNRPAGASLAELITATGWQAHSIRAALTHLRKEGCVVTRRKDAAGETRYHLDSKAR